MATNAKDGFTKALESFRKTLTPEQQKDFSFNSLGDVQVKIKSIQERYGPEKKLRNMQRLSKFLAGMKQVEELVTVFLNVHEVVAFVWGPVKFALMIASNRLETLELLLDRYVEIGEVLPSLRQYEQMFKNYPYLREVLERCFYDILEFHKEALNVFTRTGWKKYLDCAWNTFETRCKPIIDSLKRHRTLLSDEKLTAAIIEVQEGRREAQEFRDTVKERFGEILRRLEIDSEKTSKQEAEAMKESLLRARCTISSQLSPGSYEDDQRSAFSQFFSSPEADWVLQEPRFKGWLRRSNGQILYLHGMPGAGKTTLTSRIINYLQSQKSPLDGPLLYFYFKGRQEGKRSMSDMLRALLCQLISQDDIAADYVRQRWFSPNGSDLKSLHLLQELVQDSLATPRGGTIVLDGLDECQDEWSTRKEPQVIIDWIHQNLISEARSQGYPIRILVSSQHVDFLKKELTEHPSIRLDQDAGHLRNIQAYAKSEASRIQKRFFLDDRKRDSIVEKVSASSDGFFLYARVVLDNLMEQGSQSELDEELDVQIFPGNLEAAYERVVTRVFDYKNRPKKAAAASKILSWMTCAARPLYWREIQSLFCINSEKGECISKALCSSLVEEDLPDQAEGEVREPIVRLVHTTAGGYLVHTARINLLEAHASMALFCSQYLTSQPFQDGPRAETIQEFAKTGYYGFLDYAMASWTHHLALVSKDSSSLQADTLSKLISRVSHILESYEIPKETSSGREVTTQALENTLKVCLANARKGSFESRISTIRNAIESIRIADLDDHARCIFLGLNGAPCFKCPKQNCNHFTTGFSSWKGREDHVRDHERPFRCSGGGCYRALVGFPSQSDLQSHTRRCHPTAEPLALFPNPRAARPRTIFDACIKGDLEQVKAFLSQGVDVNASSKSKGHLTPLVLAAKHGQHHICHFLIETGAKQVLGFGNESALGCAIERHDPELVWLFVRAASDEMKTRLIDRGSLGARISSHLSSLVDRDGQILQAVLSLCDPIPVERLPFNLQPHMWPYHVVSESDSLSDFEVILNWAVSENGTHGPTLDAARAGSNSIAERRYALITQRYENNDSLLHVASRNERVSIMRYLIHRLKLKDITATNFLGYTPLQEIVLTRSFGEAATHMATLLVKADNGFSANTTSIDDWLPIQVACDSGLEKIVVVLASSTHDLDSKNLEGNTVLMSAVNQNMTLAVKAFLETKRVDVCAQNADGETAADLAFQREDVDMLQLLHTYHHATVPRKGPMGLFGKDPFEYCIKSQKWELLARIEKFLGLRFHKASLRLTHWDPDIVQVKTLGYLQAFGCTLTAKAILSSGKLHYSGAELEDLWKLVEGQEDDEVRVMMLLQGPAPKHGWDEQLPAIKRLLQGDSPAPAFMQLLQANGHARQALIDQVKSREDKELKELWSRMSYWLA